MCVSDHLRASLLIMQHRNTIKPESGVTLSVCGALIGTGDSTAKQQPAEREGEPSAGLAGCSGAATLPRYITAHSYVRSWPLGKSTKCYNMFRAPNQGCFFKCCVECAGSAVIQSVRRAK